MEKRNYHKEMENQISSLRGRRARLLLHSCCGPCSSYVLECLAPYFDVTVFFCNPNIYPTEEYEKRLLTQKQLVRGMTASTGFNVDFLEASYEPTVFSRIAAGLENEPEGGARCVACISHRLEMTAKAAAEHGFEFFTTTLSVSPHKNPQLINQAGEALSKKYGSCYLFSDFKKRGGYKRSIDLSREYNLYRQNYCGCAYSIRSAGDTNE